jgi:hypothetical protein
MLVAVGKITQLKFCKSAYASLRNLVAGGRIELPTRGFSTVKICLLINGLSRHHSPKLAET